MLTEPAHARECASRGTPRQLHLPYPLILNSSLNFGVQNNQFGFTIAWAANLLILVEASTSLSNSDWSPVATNLLIGGSAYFSDPQWTNYPGRYYRIRAL
jgi:hypothetical protein